MEAWDLYLITRLDGIRGFMSWAWVLVIMGGVSSLLSSVLACDANEITDAEFFKDLRKHVLIVVAIMASMGIVHSMTPTSKEVLAFISVDYITHEEKVINTADKLYEVLDQYLDGKIEETNTTK